MDNLFQGYTYPLVPDHATPEDVQALKKLHEMTKMSVGPVKNCFLEVEPCQIPEHQRYFFADKIDFLTEALVLKSGSWKKYRRELGWSVRSDGIWCIKRTFCFHTKRHGKETKTNWILDAYLGIDKFEITTNMYLCHVFQSNNYDPRPPPPVFKAKAFGDENCEPNMAGPSTRVASGKRRKDGGHELPYPSNAWDSSMVAKAWSGSTERKGDGSSRGINKLPGQSTAQLHNFTEVKACSGPSGEVLALSICNHCGIVYRSSSGLATLNKHTAACKNACQTTPRLK